MLKIQNLYNIVGQQLYSKWIPNSYGWAVRGVEEVGDKYIFELVNTNGKYTQAEIQLRRQPIWDMVAKQTVYELWAWNLEEDRPETLWRTKGDIMTPTDTGLWLAMILDKIIPSK
jgi:hypothetical protein